MADTVHKSTIGLEERCVPVSNSRVAPEAGKEKQKNEFGKKYPRLNSYFSGVDISNEEGEKELKAVVGEMFRMQDLRSKLKKYEYEYIVPEKKRKRRRF